MQPALNDNNKYVHLDRPAQLNQPKFMSEQKITGARKGTLIHLCMQKLNEKEEYDINKLQKMVQELVQKKIILQNEAESINLNKILNFTKNKIWKELKTAKLVEKEKPFYINIPAKEVYENKIENEILVQGIIDLYYINQNDELILVDYKTDYVENRNEEILKEKYKSQLELYKKALEQALNRKVSKVYIYSTYLDKEIMM